VLQPYKKTRALAARFPEKCAALHAYAFQTTTMVEPGDLSCDSDQNLKPSSPWFPLKRQKAELRGAEPVRVKTDMPQFIAQNLITNLLENRITRALTQEPVVCGAYQFRNDQHLQLEIQTERPTNASEKRMRPMPSNLLSTESIDEFSEQPGMFLLFGNEEFQRFAISQIVWNLLRRRGEQKIALTAFT
jgi:hypothetical protein